VMEGGALFPSRMKLQQPQAFASCVAPQKQTEDMLSICH
jgi:hypothetical protein